MTLDEVRSMLDAIRDTHPRSALSARNAKAWHDILGDLPFIDAKVALTRTLRESTRTPTPADIVRLRAEIRAETGGDQPQRPICARCSKEQGITVNGGFRAPLDSVIGPKDHGGPREPLCSFHLELTTWERLGKDRGYPAPAWTRGPATGKQAVENRRKLERLLAGSSP
jgi:hypothetical protein